LGLKRNFGGQSPNPTLPTQKKIKEGLKTKRLKGYTRKKKGTVQGRGKRLLFTPSMTRSRLQVAGGGITKVKAETISMRIRLKKKRAKMGTR